MFHKTAERAASVIGLTVLTIMVLVGCGQVPSHPPVAPTASSAAADPTGPTRESATLVTARRLADSYNYGAALKTLRSGHGDRTRRLRATIRSEQAKAHTWKHPDQISHLFFHSLIVDPARAFHAGSKSQGYRDYMVTVKEFRAILPQLRRRGYVLVLPRQIAKPDRHGTMHYRKIKLPPGKKPLVISQDDVNYYEYMRGDGFAQNLTVTADNKITNTYRTRAGRTVQGSYDVLPILDDFIAAHPDFSYRGAKGVLALTGYNGILGYRTSQREYAKRSDFAAQRRTARRVATAIKSDGWQLASHSWGHLNFTTTPLSELKADTRRWNREVKTLTGPTDLLVYPFGADISGVQPYGNANAKYRYLHKQGFNFYFNVDASHPAWMQNHAGSIRQARINVDGIRMASTLDGQNTVLKHFFDVKSVIDPARHLKIKTGTKSKNKTNSNSKTGHHTAKHGKRG